MSHDALKWLDKAAPKADLGRPVHRAVLWNLSWRYSDKYRCAWPKVSTIMLDTGYGRSGVQTALRELEADGWIRRDFRADQPTRYALPRYERWVAEGRPIPEDATDGEAEEPAQGAQEVSPPAQEVSAGAQDASVRGSGGEHRTTSNQIERNSTSVKPLRGVDEVRFIYDGPITEAQLTWLHDMYVMTTGFPWSPEELERERSMTSAEADEAIKSRWGDIEHEGRDNIALTIPKGNLRHLSQRGLAWLHGTPTKDVA